MGGQGFWVGAWDIIGTNLLTKFHDDQKINVASRPRKNALPPGSHVFKPTGIIFEPPKILSGLIFLPINVASRVLTRFYYSHIRKIAPPLGSHVFQANIIIFKLIQDIIETNLLTKFHEDWTNVASRIHIMKNAPPPCCYVFKATKTIFELNKDIIETNLLTKFHDDWKINWPCFSTTGIIFELFHTDWTMNVAYRVKNAPPFGSHVFQANVTILELIQDINKTNFLTIFHEDWTINVASRVLTRKNAPPPGSHVFQPTGIIFELVQDIIGMHLLTKFHEDLTINVASRVFIIFYYSHLLFLHSHIRKNAPPLGSHVFQAKLTIFELIQDNIGTNLLSNFHEDRTINVASRVLTRKYGPPPGGHVFQPTGIIIKLVQDIKGVHLLTKFHEDQTIIQHKLQYQFEVNRCRNEEILVKGNFGWAWPLWAGRPRIDYIVIKEVQHQFEVNQCRNEEIIVKGNFGWAWPMWAGCPRVEVQYQFEVNRCRNEEIIVKGNFGWAWPMWA
ncbi:hypothetical protein DPMN_160904 [Dreissena polymorpha]|uniref:Uncharacterized protein n=1 Tax=Dreissena polymorpha TaxID=45954 RepID=A0A9D4ELN8_DREPO|nr:hypothetical protein DPMN_160904 [Dreissena polymorpha]